MRGWGRIPRRSGSDEAIRDYGIRYEYDTLGRPVRSVDANGNKTLFYYDRENRRTHTINVIGQAANNTLAGEVSETTYNSFGQPESVRRYAARLGDADMDQLLAGRWRRPRRPVAAGQARGAGRPSLDQVSLYEYDRCGRLVKQVDGENGVTENIYNVHGELAAQVRSTRRGSDHHQAVRLRPERARGVADRRCGRHQREHPDGLRRFRSRDPIGRRRGHRRPRRPTRTAAAAIVVTDPLQRATRTDYDALGRVSRVTDALGHQTVTCVRRGGAQRDGHDARRQTSDHGADAPRRDAERHGWARQCHAIRVQQGRSADDGDRCAGPTDRPDDVRQERPPDRSDGCARHGDALRLRPAQPRRRAAGRSGRIEPHDAVRVRRARSADQGDEGAGTAAERDHDLQLTTARAARRRSSWMGLRAGCSCARPTATTISTTS